MLSKLEHKVQKLKPRRFRVYCVGAAKTGSTSLAAMFKSHYKSAHEPETEKTNQIVINWLDGEIGKSELKRILIKRDRRLNLELESAHPVGYISHILAEVFPASKFIITIREPYSWLKSRLNFHHKFHPSAWESYRDYFWLKRNSEYAPEEIFLKEIGLCSLDTYLQQYSDHYSRVLSLPSHRCLIVKTSDINSSASLLSKFLNINKNSIDVCHSNQTVDKIEPLKEMNSDFVKSKIWQHCNEIITNFFPDSISTYH